MSTPTPTPEPSEVDQDLTWHCTVDGRTTPCGDCDGCRWHIGSLRAALTEEREAHQRAEGNLRSELGRVSGLFATALADKRAAEAALEAEREAHQRDRQAWLLVSDELDAAEATLEARNREVGELRKAAREVVDARDRWRFGSAWVGDVEIHHREQRLTDAWAALERAIENFDAKYPAAATPPSTTGGPDNDA